MLGQSGTGQYGQYPGGAGQMSAGANNNAALAQLGQLSQMQGNLAQLASLQAAGRAAQQGGALGQQRPVMNPTLHQLANVQQQGGLRLPSIQQQPGQQPHLLIGGLNGLTTPSGRTGIGLGGLGGAGNPGSGLTGLSPAQQANARNLGFGQPGGPMLPGQNLRDFAALQRGVRAETVQGGGLGALGGRLGGLGGLGAGSSSYGGPSGDLLTMLNKAGGTRQQQQQQQQQMHGGEGGGSDGGPPAFDASDFPSLSQATAASGHSSGAHRSTDGPAAESFAALVGSQKAAAAGGAGAGGAGGQLGPSFGEEDFPALPGVGAGGGGGAGTPRHDGSEGAAQLQQLQQQLGGLGAGGGGGGMGDSALEMLRLQQQQRQLQQAALKGSVMPGGGSASGAGGGSGKLGSAPQPDRFGLLGLLSVIRMTDPDLTTLALGTDLTTLGLNLNSPEALWKTFSSPWADAPGKPEPEFKVPGCYLHPPPRMQPGYFSKFQPDTLFYIFYGLPGDEAQLYAADELSSRGWYYHREYKAWLTRAPNTEPLQKTDRFERGSFFLFDPASWEVVRKDNFLVHFEALERPPNLSQQRVAGGQGAGSGAAAAQPPTGAPPPPQQPLSPVK